MTTETKTETLTTDITIIGAGMAGASMVHMLKPALEAGLTITLIDRQPLKSMSEADTGAGTGADTELPPSFDGRATALSWGTRQMLEAMGIWSDIAPHVCAIDRIHVSDEGNPGQTQLTATEQDVEALGYIVENRRLGQVLLSGMEGLSGLRMLAPCSAEKVTMTPTGARLELDSGASLETGLLIIADGGRSPLPKQLGIVHERKEYNAHALVTQVRCDQPHGHCAYERFSSDGPIAFLPLGTHDFAVAWTINNDTLGDIMALSDADLIARLQPRIGYRVGRILEVGERQTYPLALVKASEQVRRSLVLLGNTAHSIHPVAGQGFNLAFRDAAALAEHINAAARKQQPVGDLAMLQHYAAQQANDQRNTVVASDVLPSMFCSDLTAVAVIRDLGLAGMAAAPTVRRLFARHAMGLGHTAAKLG